MVLKQRKEFVYNSCWNQDMFKFYQILRIWGFNAGWEDVDDESLLLPYYNEQFEGEE